MSDSDQKKPALQESPPKTAVEPHPDDNGKYVPSHATLPSGETLRRRVEDWFPH